MLTGPWVLIRMSTRQFAPATPGSLALSDGLPAVDSPSPRTRMRDSLSSGCSTRALGRRCLASAQASEYRRPVPTAPSAEQTVSPAVDRGASLPIAQFTGRWIAQSSRPGSSICRRPLHGLRRAREQPRAPCRVRHGTPLPGHGEWSTTEPSPTDRRSHRPGASVTPRPRNRSTESMHAAGLQGDGGWAGRESAPPMES